MKAYSLKTINPFFALVCAACLSGCGGSSALDVVEDGIDDVVENGAEMIDSPEVVEIDADAEQTPTDSPSTVEEEVVEEVTTDLGQTPTDALIGPSLGTWALGEIFFAGNGSGSQSNNGSSFSISTQSDTPNGEYSGSLISISAANEGPGDYILVENGIDVSVVILNSPGTKVAAVQIRAGLDFTNPLAATEWSSASGFVRITQDSDGFYSISTVEDDLDPVIFTRTLNIGEGVAGSPDNFVVTITDFNGRPE